MTLPPKTRNFSGWGEYIVPCQEPCCLCPALCDQTVTRSWNVIYLPQKEVNHKTSRTRIRTFYNVQIIYAKSIRWCACAVEKKSMTTGRFKKVACYQRSTNYSPISEVHCKHCIVIMSNLTFSSRPPVVPLLHERWERSAVSGQRWWWPRLLKLASLVLFAALNNLFFRVRVPVGVFYLNMSKKGKKQDVNDDRSKRHLKNIILLNIDLCACVCACVFVF